MSFKVIICGVSCRVVYEKISTPTHFIQQWLYEKDF